MLAIARAGAVFAVIAALWIAGIACASSPDPAPRSTKIGFDPGAIDDRGLLGTGGSSVAVHYEFCVPDVERFLAMVTDIDSTATISRSRGRIGCAERERLVIGSTHQPQWRAVLGRLAALPFVTHIARTTWD
jgi:hypothetical protein